MTRSSPYASIECIQRSLRVERLETRLPFSAGGGAPAALVVPDSFEIFASVADGDSELQTDEFIVGVQSSGESNEPSVACLADDSQIVVFLSGADGQQNVMARRLRHDHSEVEERPQLRRER